MPSTLRAPSIPPLDVRQKVKKFVKFIMNGIGYYLWGGTSLFLTFYIISFPLGIGIIYSGEITINNIHHDGFSAYLIGIVCLAYGIGGFAKYAPQLERMFKKEKKSARQKNEKESVKNLYHQRVKLRDDLNEIFDQFESEIKENPVKKEPRNKPIIREV